MNNLSCIGLCWNETRTAAVPASSIIAAESPSIAKGQSTSLVGLSIACGRLTVTASLFSNEENGVKKEVPIFDLFDCCSGCACQL